MPEKQNIEWKAKWKDEYLEWICGFANAQGGRIYIGCNDDGEVVGVSNAKKLMEDIPNKVRDSMGIIVDVNLLEKDKKQYIEIYVPEYPIGVSCKGVYYYRTGSTKQILTGTALETFLMRRRGVTWDNLPLPSFKLEDIDKDAIDAFKDKAAKKGRIDADLLNEPDDIILEKLHLTNDGYLTNAAMLLFSEDPERWQLGAFLKIGYFESDADLLYQDEVRGPLFEQVDKALELIYFKYMRAKITYEGIQRRERYFVPEAALRETLLNAVCHKQYQSGVPVQVSVYEDKLFVANTGYLPEHWTVQNLLSKHASRPYNPNIANVFYLAGYIESWGRGIEKICKSCSDDDLPVPRFTVDPGDIMVEFSAPEDRVVRSGMANDRVYDKVNDRVNDRVNDVWTLTDREREVLSLLEDDPGYTVTQLADRMSLSRKTISGYLQSLQKKGRICRIGSSRRGYWKINREESK